MHDPQLTTQIVLPLLTVGKAVVVIPVAVAAAAGTVSVLGMVSRMPNKRRVLHVPPRLCAHCSL